MSEYIEREALIAAYDAAHKGPPGGARKLMEDAPAADVEEVKHGRCPVCNGEKAILQDCDNEIYVEVDAEQQEMSVWIGDECIAVFSIDYCPNCGAKMDGGTDKAVLDFVPNIDKDELIRALNYDRGQYEKGYADGKRDAMADLVRCKDCEHVHWYEEYVGSYYPFCTHNFCETKEDYFCSYGERKEVEQYAQN